MRKTLVALLLLPSVAQAEFWSGNTLLNRMMGNPNDQLIAIGYVTGAADAVTGVFACPPAGATVGQVHDMTKRLLDNSPELRHKAADLFVRAAMEAAWPCKSNNRGA